MPSHNVTLIRDSKGKGKRVDGDGIVVELNYVETGVYTWCASCSSLLLVIVSIVLLEQCIYPGTSRRRARFQRSGRHWKQ